MCFNGMHMDRFAFCKSKNINFTKEQAMEIQRGSRSIAIFFLYPRR